MDYRTALENRVRDMFKMDSTGHDMDHLKRVEKIALHLQQAEGGDREIISTAALLHDVHRLMEKERGSFCSPVESLPTIRIILKEINFDQSKIEQVLHCLLNRGDAGGSPNHHHVGDLRGFDMRIK